METIASNDFYTIEVDKQKNRIYFTMRGSWTVADDIPAWGQDVEKAVSLCQPGFTELIDWCGSTGIFLTDFIADAQQIAIKGGLRKAARVYEYDTFVKLQMDRITLKTGFPVESFYDRREAELWLDAE